MDPQQQGRQMLVLSRKKGEAIVVGDITIVVTDIRGDKVRLGVEAPREVPVDREEIRKRKDDDRLRD